LAIKQSLSGFKVHIQRALSAPGNFTVGATGGKLGFFGKAPVAKPSALTAASGSTVGATFTATEQGVVNNTRTRVNEIETALKNLGILS
jgi:hypothetical protein